MKKDIFSSARIFEQIKEIWNSNDLFLDLPIIDLQHLWLVAILVDLRESLNNRNATPEQYRASLKEAAKYTYVHFTLEEELMKQINFPDIEDHIKMHRAFTKSLNHRIPINHPVGREDVEELTNHLQEWLFKHIIREDAKYRDVILKNKISTPNFSVGVEEITDPRILPEQKQLYTKIMEARSDDFATEEIIDAVADIWERYKLSVYVPIVDIQHMWLVRLVVELDKASRMPEQDRMRVFNKTIVSAIDYVKEHFATEEILMAQYHFPGYARQQKQHRYFVDFITRRNEESKEGDPMAVGNLVGDLKDWLLTHIAVEDKKLHGFFKDRMPEVLAFTKNLIHRGEIVLRKGQVNLYQQVLKRIKSDDFSLN